MATTVLAQVRLTRDNNIPADDVMNTWHFKIWQVDDVAACTAILVELQAFYVGIQEYLGNTLTGTGTVQFYDLAAVPPRVPIFDGELTFTPDASLCLPAEVAICMSYRGTLVSGSNAARRRGRIFLGPVTTDVLLQETGEIRVTSACTEGIADLANTLMNAGDTSTWTWAVFSPTTAGAPPWSAGELTAATLSVVAGHVDNAFDTIRSRGAAATDRSVWS